MHEQEYPSRFRVVIQQRSWLDCNLKYIFLYHGKPGLNVACALTDPVTTNTTVI
jgi:hypothetical protein